MRKRLYRSSKFPLLLCTTNIFTNAQQASLASICISHHGLEARPARMFTCKGNHWSATGQRHLFRYLILRWREHFESPMKCKLKGKHTRNPGFCYHQVSQRFLQEKNKQTNSGKITVLLLPSGKHTKNYGKSSFFMGNLTISMAIFNS